MLSAIIGANSAGKSTILLALDMAFGNTAKLDEAMFNGKQTDEPVIVEVTVQGEIERLASGTPKTARSTARRMR